MQKHLSRLLYIYNVWGLYIVQWYKYSAYNMIGCPSIWLTNGLCFFKLPNQELSCIPLDHALIKAQLFYNHICDALLFAKDHAAIDPALTLVAPVAFRNSVSRALSLKCSSACLWAKTMCLKFTKDITFQIIIIKTAPTSDLGHKTSCMLCLLSKNSQIFKIHPSFNSVCLKLSRLSDWWLQRYGAFKLAWKYWGYVGMTSAVT